MARIQDGLEVNSYEWVQRQAVNGLIYCECEYEYRDKIKVHGFRWSPELKMWYIPLSRFTPLAYQATRTYKNPHEQNKDRRNYHVHYYSSFQLLTEYPDLEDRQPQPRILVSKINKYTRSTIPMKKIF